MTGVCDVVADTCVAFVGHTVRLTVMVFRIGNGLQLLVNEQKLDHSCLHFLVFLQLHIPVYNKNTLKSHLFSNIPVVLVTIVKYISSNTRIIFILRS